MKVVMEDLDDRDSGDKKLSAGMGRICANPGNAVTRSLSIRFSKNAILTNISAEYVIRPHLKIDPDAV
jgi:hypothetical protein